MLNRLHELLPDTIPFATHDVVIEPSLAHLTDALCARSSLPTNNLFLVCDENTWPVLGKRIGDELRLPAKQIVVLESPHADEAHVAALRALSASALIAVGSGTVSDLCKYASYLDKIPYVVAPTALSMNGYLSANASITLQGHKQTLTAHLPIAVWCDLEILAQAPLRLTLSGLGDSLCRSTAQTDWLLSHLLLGTPYDPLPFALLAPYEQKLFEHSDQLARGDLSVVSHLLKTLLISGAGMTIAGGSYPASQGEHLIAHTLEMKQASSLPANFHGEQIGVTTLTMARIQETILAHPLTLRATEGFEKRIARYFTAAPAAESITAAYQAKLSLLHAQQERVESKLNQHEAEIRATISKIMLPSEYLHSVLVRAGAKTTPEALGWQPAHYNAAIEHAHFIRDRFTFLDLYKSY